MVNLLTIDVFEILNFKIESFSMSEHFQQSFQLTGMHPEKGNIQINLSVCINLAEKKNVDGKNAEKKTSKNKCRRKKCRSSGNVE
jgi:hypothetical protein